MALVGLLQNLGYLFQVFLSPETNYPEYKPNSDGWFFEEAAQPGDCESQLKSFFHLFSGTKDVLLDIIEYKEYTHARGKWNSSFTKTSSEIIQIHMTTCHRKHTSPSGFGRGGDYSKE